jgi:phasin family protein
MEMAKNNLFFDFDVSKIMADFKVPGVDVEAIMSSQRKNIEALTAANQLAFEGFQAVLRRQSEILRQTLEQNSAALSDLMAAGSPEDKIAKQAELVKVGFEKALSNMRELAELVAKAQQEAAEVVSKRVTESLEEMKGVIQKPRK